MLRLITASYCPEDSSRCCCCTLFSLSLFLSPPLLLNLIVYSFRYQPPFPPFAALPHWTSTHTNTHTHIYPSSWPRRIVLYRLYHCCLIDEVDPQGFVSAPVHTCRRVHRRRVCRCWEKSVFIGYQRERILSDVCRRAMKCWRNVGKISRPRDNCAFEIKHGQRSWDPCSFPFSFRSVKTAHDIALLISK